MFVKFKQCIFQKLHPLVSSELSKTKIQAGDMPKMSFLWHYSGQKHIFSCLAMDNYTFSERSMHDFNDKTG